MARRLHGILLTAALLVPSAVRAQSNQLAAYSVLGAEQARLRARATVQEGDVGSLGDPRSRARHHGERERGRACCSSSGRGRECSATPTSCGSASTSGRFSGPSTRRSRSPSSRFPRRRPSARCPSRRSRSPPGARSSSPRGAIQSLTGGPDAGIVFQGGVYDVGELVLRGRANQMQCASGATCTVRVASRLSLGADLINTHAHRARPGRHAPFRVCRHDHGARRERRARW